MGGELVELFSYKAADLERELSPVRVKIGLRLEFPVAIPEGADVCYGTDVFPRRGGALLRGDSPGFLDDQFEVLDARQRRLIQRVEPDYINVARIVLEGTEGAIEVERRNPKICISRI